MNSKFEINCINRKKNCDGKLANVYNICNNNILSIILKLFNHYFEANNCK